MAQHAHIPKFGNWEEDDNAPYSQYFENARKGRGGGKLINPNDPQENPDAFPEDVPPAQRRGDQEAPKPKEQRASRENGNRRRSDSSLGRDAMAQKSASDSPNHGSGVQAADPRRRAGRISGGPDRSTEQSPLHPHYHGKAASKGGVSSPSWERKGSSEGGHGLALPAPGRSRMRPSGPGDETPERGSTVPKFGEWDESNPSSADGYSVIFNKVREEKQTASAKVPIISNDSGYVNGHNQNSSSRSTGCWCFGWGKK